MSVSQPNTEPAAIYIKIRPRSISQRRDVLSMRRDLEHIARFVGAGGITELFLFLARRLIVECGRGMTPFEAIDRTTKSLADEYERRISEKLGHL